MTERLQRMADEANLPFVMKERMINSRRALEASEYAREQGRHEAFHRVVFRKFYGKGQDMHDWDVLQAAAKEVGLDPDEMREKTVRGEYSAVVTHHIQQAHAQGISGVPAYIIGNKYLIMGAQPYDVFRQAMAKLQAETAKETETPRAS